MSGTDQLLSYLAQLQPRTAMAPEKPRKRVKENNARHIGDYLNGARRLRVPYTTLGGALSPTRCGAVQSQTRSMKLGVTTQLDLAAGLAAVRDPLAFELVRWFGGMPQRRDHIFRLLHGLEFELAAEALYNGWEVYSGDSELPARAVAMATMAELRIADACQRCNTNKVEYHQNQWIGCRACGGKGYHPHGRRRRIPLVRQFYGRAAPKEEGGAPLPSRDDYVANWAPGHAWLYNRCMNTLDEAWADIRDSL